MADVFFVQAGTATLLVGDAGGAETVSPHEKRTGDPGRDAREIVAETWVRIPARVCRISAAGWAKQFTYFVIKIKNY